MDWVELAVALALILFGAELFTNGVEWLGEGFGLSEGAVGSVLAAIGTALPETVLPFIAILGGGGAAAREIGTGAILGAPFMLSTLAMCMVGGATLLFARGGRRGRAVRPEPRVIRHDLSFFLGMYALALLAGLLDLRPVDWLLAACLVGGYVFYVWRHFATPGERELQSEAIGEVAALRIRAWWFRLRGRADPVGRPEVWQSAVQTLVALGIIVGAAKVFVIGMEAAAGALHVPHLVFALLVAPVATELPETFNSVLWLRRRKDTLALGNVTGAMVFQSAFPVSIGLLFTPWRLADDTYGLVSACLALVAAAVVLGTLRLRGRLAGALLLGEGAFYAGFIAYVVASRA